MGEEFDRNPFLIFKLRGMEREELVALLDQGAPKAQRGKKKSQAVTGAPQSATVLPSEPLAADIPGFWGEGSFPDDLFGEVQVPPTPAALVKRLGNFPFWRGKERFLDAIEPIYTNASARGLDVFLGAREAK